MSESSDPGKVHIKDVKSNWLLRGKAAECKCATCPFGGGARRGLNQPQEALAQAQVAVELGLDFFCHSTVWHKSRGRAVPVQQPKHNWRLCAGFVAAMHEKSVRNQVVALRAQGRLID